MYRLSTKPHKELDEILALQVQAIKAIVKLGSVLRDEVSQLDLLPVVVDLRLGNILIVPPSIGQSQLPVDHVVDCPQPVAHVHALPPQVVLQIVRVFYVPEIHHDLRVPFGRGREVVLVQKGLKGVCILNAGVGVKGNLFAFSIDFKHEVISPLIVGEGGRQFIGNVGNLPIDVAFLPHPVDVLRDQPVVPLHVNLRCIEICQPFSQAKA
jgi:hypothetical protein